MYKIIASKGLMTCKHTIWSPMYSVFFLYHDLLGVWSWGVHSASSTHSIEVSASLMRQQPTMHPPYCYLLRDYPIVSATDPHRRCLTVLRPVPHSERAVIFSWTVREMDSAAMNLRTVWLGSIIIRYLILLRSQVTKAADFRLFTKVEK